ncbi:acyltransferase family protein [Humibacter ginsengiterrae]
MRGGGTETPAHGGSRPAFAGGSRSGAVDAVRVVGILAVVAGHTLSFPVVRPLLYSWHVPLFFFLSGYFFARNRTVTDELKRRSRTLGRPYLAWFVLIGIVFVALDSTLESATCVRLFGPFVNGQHSAMPYTTFWFVAVLFFTTVLLRCLWQLPRPVLWLIGIGGAVAGYTIGDTLARTPLSVGSALPCLIFLLLGGLAHDLRPRIAAPGSVGLGLLLLAGISIVTGFSAPVDIKQGDFGTPVLSTLVAAMISFGLILVVETGFTVLGERSGRIATQLSYAGFMVVLTHPLVLWLILTFGPSIGPWLLFATCAIIPWAAALLALRTRFAAWLTGIARTPDAAIRSGIHP